MKVSEKMWLGECLRKKPMKEEHANAVVKRAAAEGNFLRAYLCNHCARYHVTRDKEYQKK